MGRPPVTSKPSLGLSRTTIWRLREHHGLEIATTTNPPLTSHRQTEPRITRREFR